MNKNIYVSSEGKLFFEGEGTEYPCALGKGGVKEDKKEGDGATPAGCFPIREIFYRRDRVEKPDTVLPTREIEKDDGWCDDPQDENYNKHVKLPYKVGHGSLWREDGLYDIVVILGFNDDPPEPGKGSAVFVHIARPEFTPTAGCIALKKEDILEVLEQVDEDTLICIEDGECQ